MEAISALENPLFEDSVETVKVFLNANKVVVDTFEKILACLSSKNKLGLVPR